MTASGYQRVLELANEATPGPWFYDSYGSVSSLPLVQEYNRLERDIPDDAADDDPRWDVLPETRVAFVPVVAGDTATKQGAKDAAFIAEARAMLPALIEAAVAVVREWDERGDGGCTVAIQGRLRFVLGEAS